LICLRRDDVASSYASHAGISKVLEDAGYPIGPGHGVIVGERHYVGTDRSYSGPEGIHLSRHRDRYELMRYGSLAENGRGFVVVRAGYHNELVRGAGLE
jgi:hypothetical protein